MLNDRQREVLAGKLADLGNIGFGSLVFGYVVHSQAFNEFTLLLGFSFAIITYSLTIFLQK